MEVSSKLKNEIIEIILKGQLRDYENYAEIKNFIKSEILENSNIIFYFINMTYISPYILGYILKLKEINKLHISIVVSNGKLYDFLLNADFDKFFNIKIKEYE